MSGDQLASSLPVHKLRSDLAMHDDIIYHTAEILWMLAIIAIALFSVVGNITILYSVYAKQSLRRPCFYLLCNNSLADVIRSFVCFPFILTALWNGTWVHSSFVCDMMGFFTIYMSYGTMYSTFLTSLERFVVLRFHRFHRQSLSGLICLLMVLFIWGIAVGTAFPPVFNPTAYSYSEAEYQCTFKHNMNSQRSIETGYYVIFFIAINFLIIITYIRVFLFMRTHRKMRPLHFVPAVSGTWTFYGPGSTGQAATNWFLGFRHGTAPPPLVGPGPPPNRAHLALSNANFFREERTSKIFFAIAMTNIVLATPYMICCFMFSFDSGVDLPRIYITNATWLTFLQACVAPLICVLSIPEIRSYCCRCVTRVPPIPPEESSGEL